MTSSDRQKNCGMIAGNLVFGLVLKVIKKVSFQRGKELVGVTEFESATPCTPSQSTKTRRSSKNRLQTLDSIDFYVKEKMLSLSSFAVVSMRCFACFIKKSAGKMRDRRLVKSGRFGSTALRRQYLVLRTSSSISSASINNILSIKTRQTTEPQGWGPLTAMIKQLGAQKWEQSDLPILRSGATSGSEHYR